MKKKIFMEMDYLEINLINLLIIWIKIYFIGNK